MGSVRVVAVDPAVEVAVAVTSEEAAAVVVLDALGVTVVAAAVAAASAKMSNGLSSLSTMSPTSGVTSQQWEAPHRVDNDENLMDWACWGDSLFC